MTYLPALLDFDRSALVKAGTASSTNAVRVCGRAEQVAATSPHVPAAQVDAQLSDSEAKEWTAQEIALATFWVAG